MVMWCSGLGFGNRTKLGNTEIGIFQIKQNWERKRSAAGSSHCLAAMWWRGCLRRARQPSERMRRMAYS